MAQGGQGGFQPRPAPSARWIPLDALGFWPENRGGAGSPEGAAGDQAMADVPRALDIHENQVAIKSTSDSGDTWVHVVLAHQVETRGTKWIGFASDLRARFVDLRTVSSLLLIRDGPIPDRLRGNWLGMETITDDELTVGRRNCYLLAIAMAEEWRYSDPNFAKHGWLVDPGLVMDPDRFIRRHAVGLVLGEANGVELWTTAESLPLQVRIDDHRQSSLSDEEGSADGELQAAVASCSQGRGRHGRPGGHGSRGGHGGKNRHSGEEANPSKS